MLVDVYIIVVMYVVFFDLGFVDCVCICISNCKVFNGLVDFFEFDFQLMLQVLCAIDKFDGQNWNIVVKELMVKVGFDV